MKETGDTGGLEVDPPAHEAHSYFDKFSPKVWFYLEIDIKFRVVNKCN